MLQNDQCRKYSAPYEGSPICHMEGRIVWRSLLFTPRSGPSGGFYLAPVVQATTEVTPPASPWQPAESMYNKSLLDRTT